MTDDLPHFENTRKLLRDDPLRYCEASGAISRWAMALRRDEFQGGVGGTVGVVLRMIEGTVQLSMQGRNARA